MMFVFSVCETCNTCIDIFVTLLNVYGINVNIYGIKLYILLQRKAVDIVNVFIMSTK